MFVRFSKIMLILMGMCLTVNVSSKEPARAIPTKIDNVQRDCIVEALWHEARGEPERGIKAVATVIINRAQSSNTDYCKVVRAPGQFSYVHQQKHKGLKPKVREGEKETFTKIVKIADSIVQGRFVKNLPHNVLWYTEKSAQAVWSRRMVVYQTIGNHKFYKA